MERKLVDLKSALTEKSNSVWLGRAVRKQQSSAPQPSSHDYRICIRQDIPYEVVINHGMRSFTAWKIRNMSMGGAFVEMPVEDIQEGHIVEFVLSFRKRGCIVEHRFPGKVVRVQLNGVALQFGQYGSNAYTDLANLLYAV